MSLAHKYYNTLIEIEVNRRKAVDSAQSLEAVASLTKEVESFTDQIEELRAQLQKTRQKKRSSAPGESADVRQQVAALSALRKEAYAKLNAAKSEARQNPKVQAAIAAANQSAAEAVKAARGATSLYWGSYLHVESAVESAAKKTAYPNLPRFKRWTGDGHLAVQLQGGLSTADAHKFDTRCWIDPVDPTAYVKGTPLRERKQHTVVHFRVGSEGKSRAPLFADIPIKMHRPLPPGMVKWVHLLRRRVADREQWFVQFVVHMEDTLREPCGQGSVGIDVGWRQKDEGGLRVAVLRDEYGKTEELALPAALLAKHEHVQGLQALRAVNFDKVKLDIVGWLSSKPEGVDVQPQHVSMWRNPGRVHKLLADHGSAMTDELREKLTAYLKQDRHLWQWQENERQKVLAQRKSLYMNFAVRIARTYSRVAIEALDLRDFAKRGPVEDDTQTDQRKTQRNRQFASLHQLRACLKQACVARDVLLGEVPPEFTTLNCHLCGHTNQGPIRILQHTCEGCGSTWDQDDNAAANLLASAVLLKPVDQTPVDASNLSSTKFSAKQKTLRKNRAAA
jgi:hypothetical protein